MPLYYYPLAGFALLTLWASWRVPRARWWIGLTVLSFTVSSLWWAFNGDYPSAFGAATDFIAAVVMLKFYRTNWEFWIVNVFGLMMLIQIIHHSAGIPPHYIYALVLEGLNCAILAIVLTMGTLQRMPANGLLPHRRRAVGFVDWARRYLVAEKRYPRWWRVAG